MYTIRVSVDYAKLTRAALRAGTPMVETEAAVRKAALFAQRKFQENLGDKGGKHVTWSGGSFVIHKVTGTYQGSITMIWPFEGMTTQAWVGPRGCAYASAIEKGYEGFSIKDRMLATSPKVKHTKDGHRYIIIPLWYKGGKKRAKAEFGSTEEAARHGVVRTSRKRFHSQWTKFRVMSDRPGSAKWFHPGADPRPVGRATMEFVRPQYEMLVKTGLAKDLKRIVSGGA